MKKNKSITEQTDAPNDGQHREVPATPCFTPGDVKRMAKDLYGLGEVTVKPLDSYSDKNFFLADKSGGQWVFKIANDREDREVLDAQNQAMHLIARHNIPVKCPEVKQTVRGEEITPVQCAEGKTHLVRMLTFVPGKILAGSVHTPQLMESLGCVLGELSKILERFHHPALHRYLLWDLKHFTDVEEYLDDVAPPRQRSRVRHVLEQFKRFVVPVLPGLRMSAIHNDFNDYNLLVNPAGNRTAISGLIDFGDMVHSYTIIELAVAIAYAIHRQPDPLETAARIVGAYHKVYPVAERELAILYYLICARLCCTITICAHELKKDPRNEYLNVSVAPAREALQKMIAVPPEKAHHVSRKACKLPV